MKIVKLHEADSYNKDDLIINTESNGYEMYYDVAKDEYSISAPHGYHDRFSDHFDVYNKILKYNPPAPGGMDQYELADWVKTQEKALKITEDFQRVIDLNKFNASSISADD